MNTAKRMLVVGAITTVVGAGAFAGVASAQTASDGTDQSLAQKIAQKFNLNKDDVQQVIDQNKTDHQAERQQRMDDRLTQAVKDGKITSAQKDAITAKIQDLKTYMDSIKDKTVSEKHSLMKAKMDELKQWAQDNGLSQYVPMMNGRGHHGMGMMFKDDNSSSNDNNSSSN